MPERYDRAVCAAELLLGARPSRKSSLGGNSTPLSTSLEMYRVAVELGNARNRYPSPTLRAASLIRPPLWAMAHKRYRLFLALCVQRGDVASWITNLPPTRKVKIRHKTRRY